MGQHNLVMGSERLKWRAAEVNQTKPITEINKRRYRHKGTRFSWVPFPVELSFPFLGANPLADRGGRVRVHEFHLNVIGEMSVGVAGRGFPHFADLASP